MKKSWIFIPGNKERYLEKSKELESDILIFDLEDSVVPNEKVTARFMVKKCIDYIESQPEKYVRVNEISSLFFMEDVKELVNRNLDGIVVPKVNNADEMKIVDYIISQAEREKGLEIGSVKVVPLLETGEGITNAACIASSIERVELLAFGSEDYMLDVNIPKDAYGALQYARSALVNASSAAGIASPIDSIYPDFNNTDGLLEASKKSRGIGFQGRLVIHPAQLKTVNDIYAPTSTEIQEAQKIVDAYDSSFDEGRGALVVDGKMIDAPVAERAKKLLEM